jgi:N-acetylneuraminic acid mutarotase
MPGAFMNRNRFAVLGLMFLSAAAPAAVWEELKSMPTPRSEMGAAYYRGKIYVPGGLGGLTAFEAYDIATSEWKSLAPLPEGRHHLAVTAHAGSIYVFGGADAQWSPVATAWKYDPKSNRWSRLKDLPEPRYAAAATALGDHLYVVGGDGPSGRLLRYHPASGEWAMLAETRERREHMAAAVWDDRIHAVGGRFHGRGELSSTEIYDPQRDEWIFGPPLRTARGGFSVVQANDALWVFGGEVFMTGRQTLASAEVLRRNATAFAPGPELPVPLHGVPVVAAEGHFYVLGGSERAGAIANHGRVFRMKVPD